MFSRGLCSVFGFYKCGTWNDTHVLVLSLRSVFLRVCFHTSRCLAESQKEDTAVETAARLPLIITSSLKGADFTRAGTSLRQGVEDLGPSQVPPPTEASSEGPGTTLELSVALGRISEVLTSLKMSQSADQGAPSSKPGCWRSEEGMRLSSGPTPLPLGPLALASEVHSGEAHPR